MPTSEEPSPSRRASEKRGDGAKQVIDTSHRGEDFSKAKPAKGDGTDAEARQIIEALHGTHEPNQARTRLPTQPRTRRALLDSSRRKPPTATWNQVSAGRDSAARLNSKASRSVSERKKAGEKPALGLFPPTLTTDRALASIIIWRTFATLLPHGEEQTCQSNPGTAA
jgi:hypothetical protein